MMLRPLTVKDAHLMAYWEWPKDVNLQRARMLVSLADTTVQSFMAVESGIDCAVVSVKDYSPISDELGWYVPPSLRGLGLGRRAAELLLPLVKKRYVCAIIKSGNVASQAIAERLGLQHTGHTFTVGHGVVVGDFWQKTMVPPGRT